MNFLIDLKKLRSSARHSGSDLLILLAFSAGAVLFWLFGNELFDSGAIDFSHRNFSVAFSASLLIVMLSAFSQLGPIQVAVADVLFEFVVCCLALSELLGGFSPKSALLLLLKLFALILFAMLLSKRADNSSLRLWSTLRGDKKRITDFALNSVILIILIIILLIICLMSF